MAKHKYEARASARLFAVQALYQMDIANTSLDAVISEFLAHRFTDSEDAPAADTDTDYFEQIVRGVVAHQVQIDRAIDGALAEGWQLARLDSTLRAILRCGVQELLHTPHVPPKTLISQYVDMAHAFFEGAEGGMANAVLDRVARENSDDPKHK